MIGKRNKFSLSHYRLTTFDPGIIVPVGLFEVLPGDTIQGVSNILLRTSSLNAPLMHPYTVKLHHWYVPFRLVWDDWDEFITGFDKDGAASTKTYPTTTWSSPGYGSLADHLGVPSDGGTARTTSALPVRAYQLIYNEWYRDQELQSAVTVDTTDGTDSTTDKTLRSVNWEKDYFTTCRTSTQKGSEVTLPLGTKAYVKGIGKRSQNYTGGAITTYESGESSGSSWGANTSMPIGYSTSDADEIWDGQEDSSNSGYPNIYADLTNATAASINDIREAFALQRYAENRARFGSRISEYIRYAFPGVHPDDLRVGRPAYLGGGKSQISFSEIVQGAGTTDGSSTGVGDLKGHGIAAMRSNRYRRFFSEHGYVMTLMSVVPKSIYANGLHRLWNRTTKEDHFQRELQHIGQQAVLKKEVYYDTAAPATDIFGYQDRYDEYRRMESSVSGQMRDSTSPYAKWHAARILSSEPSLNSTFITAAPADRVFQSTTNDNLAVMINHSIQARRMISKSGNPGMRSL